MFNVGLPIKFRPIDAAVDQSWPLTCAVVQCIALHLNKTLFMTRLRESNVFTSVIFLTNAFKLCELHVLVVREGHFARASIPRKFVFK